MPDQVDTLAELATKYGPTAIGLGIGSAAKYGLTLTEGRKLTWRGVIADLLLLGMLGLLAILIADQFHLAGNARVLVGALSAVSSDRLVRLVRERFVRRLSSEFEPALFVTPGHAEVPPGNGPASSARLTVSRGDDPRTAGVERLGEGPLPKTSAELDALLKQIDSPETDL